MNEELSRLVEENLKLTKDIHKMTKYVKRNVVFNQIFGFLKIVLIVIPIILGFMYLPGLYEKVMPVYIEAYKQVQNLTGISGAMNIPGAEGDEAINVTPEQLKMLQQLCK